MKFEHSDQYIKMGLKISYFRKLKGLTQDQLSEQIGKNVSYIGQIEAPNIVRAISMDTLFDIANVLEIPAYKILNFDDE